MANDQDVIIRIAADTAQLNAELQSMRSEVASAFASMAQSVSQMVPPLNAVDKGVGDLNQKLGGENGTNVLVRKGADDWKAWAIAAMGVQAGLTLVGQATSFVSNEVNKLVTFLPRLLEQTAIEERSLRQMAHSFGMTTEGASALSVAAKDMGTSLGAVNGAMFRFTMQMEQAGGPPMKVASGLNKLGISMSELNKMTKDQQFLKIMQELSKLEFGEKQTIGMELFGRSWKTLSRMASEDMAKALAEAKEFGLTYTDQQAKIAAQFANTMESFGKMTKGFKMQVANFLMPWATLVATELMEAKKKIMAAVKEVFGGVEWNSLLALALKEVVPIIRSWTDEFVKAIRDFGPVLAQLVDYFRKDLFPVIKELVRAFHEIATVGFKGFVSVLKDTVMPAAFTLLKFFKDVLVAAVPFVEMMGGSLVVALNALGAAFKGVVSFITGLPDWVKDAAKTIAAIATALWLVEKAMVALKGVQVLSWLTDVVLKFRSLDDVLSALTLKDLAGKFRSWVTPTGELATAVGGLGRAVLGRGAAGAAVGAGAGLAAGAAAGGGAFTESAISSFIADIGARAAIGDRAFLEGWLTPGASPKLINGKWELVSKGGKIVTGAAPGVGGATASQLMAAAARTPGALPAGTILDATGAIARSGVGGVGPAIAAATAASPLAVAIVSFLGVAALGALLYAIVKAVAPDRGMGEPTGRELSPSEVFARQQEEFRRKYAAIPTQMLTAPVMVPERRDPERDAALALRGYRQDLVQPRMVPSGQTVSVPYQDVRQLMARTRAREAAREYFAEGVLPGVPAAEPMRSLPRAAPRAGQIGGAMASHEPTVKTPRTPGEPGPANEPEWVAAARELGMDQKAIASWLAEDESNLASGTSARTSKSMLAFQQQARNIQIKVEEARSAGVSEPLAGNRYGADPADQGVKSASARRRSACTDKSQRWPRRCRSAKVVASPSAPRALSGFPIASRHGGGRLESPGTARCAAAIRSGSPAPASRHAVGRVPAYRWRRLR